MKFSSVIYGGLGLAALASANPVKKPYKVERAVGRKPVYQQVDHERDVPEGVNKHLRPVMEKKKRSTAKFDEGEPIGAPDAGAPLVGGTNHMLDLQNPDNLGAAYDTDEGVVPNLKWSFSDSHTRLLDGGWVREQVDTDLPSSTDMAAAQQHLKKGALRELHWHRTAEWGYVYAGSILISVVDEKGRNQVDKLEVGDIWYFPKGMAHTIQGLSDSNEYLLVFDEPDFDALGTTFMVEDWLLHTPKDVIAKNFGVSEAFWDKHLLDSDPYILPADISKDTSVSSPYGSLKGKLSTVYKLSKKKIPEVAGGGGTIAIVDSTVFPIATTLAAAIVTVKPGAMREMHWHPNAQEWLFFLQGTGRATAFLGPKTSRTMNFRAGDTAVFPDNAGHYVENTGDTDLVWIEMYKSDHVAEIPLSQWLATTPHDIAAQTLSVPVSFIDKLKKEKQLIIPV